MTEDVGPDQVLTPLSLDAWGEYHRALDFGTLNEISVAREAVEAVVRAPLEAALDEADDVINLLLGDPGPVVFESSDAHRAARIAWRRRYDAMVEALDRHRARVRAALAGVPKEAGDAGLR